MTDQLEFSQSLTDLKESNSPWQQELDSLRSGTAEATAQLQFPKVTEETVLSFAGPDLDSSFDAQIKSPTRRTIEFPLLKNA